ncbi:MAG: hypothetical protein K6G03_08205 [Lachnospiraceae bacterium]|nr:hypothetical protein [Lachnospiraceae bacterium]
MGHLMLADFRRILKKPFFYVPVVLSYFFIVFLTQDPENVEDHLGIIMEALNIFSIMLISIPVYLGVYADDHRYGITQSIIGHGISKPKLIITKLLECALLLSVFFMIQYLIIIIRNETIALAITPRHNLFLFIYSLFCVIRGISYFTLAAFVFFSFNSISGGMITLIFCSLLGGPLLKVIQTEADIPVYDFSPNGLLDASYAAIETGKSTLDPVFVALILAAFITLTIFIYKKKELEL